MWNNIEATLTLGTKNKLKFCITFDCMKDMQVGQQTRHWKVSSVSNTGGEECTQIFSTPLSIGKTEIIQIKD